MLPKADCPCHSGLRYKVCCEPFIKREADAPTPDALMRSRYTAFALGKVDYLRDTLMAGHPDGGANAPTLKDIGRMRYLGLRILHTQIAESGERGEVLFAARIFDKGVDRSFAELSRFVKQGEPKAWRYEDGDLLPGPLVPKSLEGFDRAEFLRLRATL